MAPRFFNHPTCNLIFGERLYYLLISVRSDLFEIRDRLLRSLETAGLYSTSCAYFVFGENDLLVRVWAAESQLNAFVRNFRDLAVDAEIKNFLVTHQDTWYQREIERRNGWDACLRSEHIGGLLKTGNIPPEVQYIMDGGKGTSPTKFFVIVEEQFGRGSDVFRLLQQDVRSDQPKFLSGVERPSLYAFLTDRFRGVLIKGESGDYHAVSEQLVFFAKELKLKEYAVQTTTHFCAKVIKTEDAEISGNSLAHAHLRKTDLVYNLLKAHDCHEDLWRADPKIRNRSDAFKTIVANHYEKLFNQHPDWGRQINELRRLYRWVVRQHDENLRGFLIGQYIGLEKYFRELFSPHPDLWRDNSRPLQLAGRLAASLKVSTDDVLNALIGGKTPSIHQEEFTLKHIRMCARVTKEIHANKDANAPIDELCRILEDDGTKPGIIRNRNDLMHGNVTKLFDEKAAAWPDFIGNYIQLALVLPHAKRLFEAAMQQTEKITAIRHQRSVRSP